MVSTLDSESSDPSSNLGGTLIWYASVIGRRIFLLNFYEIFLYKYIHYTQLKLEDITWRSKEWLEHIYYHEKIKFIFTSHIVIFFLLYRQGCKHKLYRVLLQFSSRDFLKFSLFLFTCKELLQYF